MADAIAWLQANWAQLLLILITIDQVLIGIFPSVAIFGSLKDILQRLIGQGPPKV